MHDLQQRYASGERDFRGRDLRGLKILEGYLGGIDLRDADLTGAHLWKVDLSDARLAGAILDDAYLAQVELAGVDANAVRARRADISVWVAETRLDRADFTHTKLSLWASLACPGPVSANYAKLIRARVALEVRNVSMYGADLTGAVLDPGSRNWRVQLDGRGVTLAGAQLGCGGLVSPGTGWLELRGADLREADLRGAVLHRVDLEDADLAMAQLDAMTFRALRVSGLRTVEARGASERLSTVLALSRGTASHIAGIDLSHTWLEGIEAPLLRLNGVDLSCANLTRARLQGAVFRDCKLDQTLLERADLRDARFKDCSMRGTVLKGADLTAARFSGVDLAEANLAGTDFERLVTDQTDVGGTALDDPAE